MIPAGFYGNVSAAESMLTRFMSEMMCFFPTKEVFLFGLSGNNVYICPLLYLSDKANRKEDDVSFG